MRLRAPRCFATVLALLSLTLAGASAAGPLASAEYAAAHHLPGPAPVAARHHGGLYRISGHGRVACAIEAWRSGDAAGLDAVLREATAGGSETAEFTAANCSAGAIRTWRRRSTS